MRLLYIQMTPLLPGIFLFWFGVVYQLQLVSYMYGHKTILQYARRSHSDTSVASVYVFQVWHVQSGHTQTTEPMHYRLR